MSTKRQHLPLIGIELDWLVQAMHGGYEQRGFLDPATGRVYLGFDGAAPLGPDGEEVDLDDAEGTAFLRHQEKLVTETHTAVEHRSGPTRVDVDDVPARWAEIPRLVADGSSVLLTEDGAAWGVVERWNG